MPNRCIHRTRLVRSLLLGFLIGSCLSTFRASAEDAPPVLLLQSASGDYTVDGETRLVIQDIEGTLSLRAAQDDTIHFEGRSLSSQRKMQDVALWRSGRHTPREPETPGSGRTSPSQGSSQRRRSRI